MVNKRGRPKGNIEDRRKIILHIRVNEREHAELKQKAEDAKTGLSDFIRNRLLPNASSDNVHT